MRAFALIPLFASAALSAAVAKDPATTQEDDSLVARDPKLNWNLRFYFESCSEDTNKTWSDNKPMGCTKLEPRKNNWHFYGSDLSGWTLNLYDNDSCEGKPTAHGSPEPASCAPLRNSESFEVSYNYSGL